MNRALALALSFSLTACASGPKVFGESDTPSPAADALYWSAVAQLDAANRQGSLDSALTYLDQYLAASTTQAHRREALVLRQLARDSRQLARVEGALQQARSDSTRGRVASDPETRRRDEESLKEIQRLKDELEKANAELERIRKRLAAPKPPSS